MRLGLCLFRYFPQGGAQLNCRRFAEAALARGHQVTLLTTQWQGEPPPKGLTLIELPVPPGSNHGRVAAFVKRVLPLLGTFDCVVGFLKMPGLDLYYAADPPLQQRLARGWRRLYRVLPRYRRYLQLEAALFQRAEAPHILALTPQAIDDYASAYGITTERFTLLAPGIMPNRRPDASAPEQRRRWRQALAVGEGLLLLALGSSYLTKGVDRALRAVASLPPTLRRQVQLAVVGRDTPFQQRRLRWLAHRLGIGHQVHWLGPRQDVPHLLWAADLLLHPARREVAGAAILEAIVAGLPVIVSGCCGYWFHVKHSRCGLWLSEPFQQQALNAALRTALEQPALRQRWRENGLAYGANPHWYRRSAQMVEVMEALATQRGVDQKPAPDLLENS